MNAIRTTAGSALPLADQVAAHFRQLIQARELCEGDLLPPASQVSNASQPIVLQAYRQLQAEGLVRIRRAHGTVVTAGPQRQCLGVLLRQEDSPSGFGAYLHRLFGGLIQTAVYHGNAPRVYLAGPYAEPAEKMLPTPLLADLARNEIRGLFVHPHPEGRAALDWLDARRIPYVLISDKQAGPGATPDHPRLLRDGVRLLRDRGCRRILAHSTFRLLDHEQVFASLEDISPARFEWRLTPITNSTVVGLGRQLAAEWLALPAGQRPDGILATDDWLATGFYVHLRAHGIRIPEDVRLAVGCHPDQLPNVLQGCDLLVLDPHEVVGKMIELLHQRIADPQAPIPSLAVPHRPLEPPSPEPR